MGRSSMPPKMKRSTRRGQQERVRARWLRRLRVGRPLTTAEERDRWAERRAPRLANHGSCCVVCSGARQQARHIDVKRARRESHHAERDGDDG